MTVGSPVPPEGLAGRTMLSVACADLATAVVHLLPPEVPEAKEQRDESPADREQPQVAGDEGGGAVGAPVLAERLAGPAVGVLSLHLVPHCHAHPRLALCPLLVAL